MTVWIWLWILVTVGFASVIGIASAKNLSAEEIRRLSRQGCFESSVKKKTLWGLFLETLCAAVFEELLYRWLVFKLVGRFTPSVTIAILISTAIFVTIEVVSRLISKGGFKLLTPVFQANLGLLFCTLFVLKGLVGCISVHALSNAACLVPVWLSVRKQETLARKQSLALYLRGA